MNIHMFMDKFLWVILAFVSSTAYSATFCVTTNTELIAALQNAEDNGQTDLIKISVGTYNGIGNQFIFQSNESNGLVISGGWSLSGNDPCGQKDQDIAFSTTLDADGIGRALKVSTPGAVTIQDLNFINGFLTSGDVAGERGGGLWVISQNNTAVIERNTFINNQAFGGGAFNSESPGVVRFQNNLVISNVTDSGNPAVVLTNTKNYVINNTIMFNTGGGLATVSNSNQKSYIANNLMWDNPTNDLEISNLGSGETFLFNNNYETSSGSNPTTQSGNISVAPQFESGILNFTPVWGSAVINSGKHPPSIFPNPIPFEADWDLGNWDFEGDTRIQNGRVDMGAVEAPTPPDLIFADGFE